MESLNDIKQLGEKPHTHDLLHFEMSMLHGIAQTHRRMGYYLYEERRKRKIVGTKPGEDEEFFTSLRIR